MQRHRLGLPSAYGLLGLLGRSEIPRPYCRRRGQGCQSHLQGRRNRPLTWRRRRHASGRLHPQGRARGRPVHIRLAPRGQLGLCPVRHEPGRRRVPHNAHR